MGNSSHKSLLILGNGANLHMNQATKWTDYWNWRKQYVMKILGIDCKLINDEYTHYYDDVKESKNKRINKFYDRFKHLYYLFDKLDDRSRIGITYSEFNEQWRRYCNTLLCYYGKMIAGRHIDGSEAHTHTFPDDKLADLSDFENILIVEYLAKAIYERNVPQSAAESDWIRDLNGTDILFPFLMMLQNSKKIEGTQVIFDTFDNMLRGDKITVAERDRFSTWWDIESLLNVSLTYLDTVNDGELDGADGSHFNTNLNIDQLAALLLEVNTKLMVQLELLKLMYTTNRNLDNVKSNVLSSKEVNDMIVSFEQLFKQYLLEHSSKFYNSEQYGLLLQQLIALDKHSFGNGESYEYDILDFNYEPLYRMLNNVQSMNNRKVFGNIYQPHGNVDRDIVIGGNQYDADKSKAVVKLSKSERNLNLFYEKVKIAEDDLIRHNNVYVLRKHSYKLDMTQYESIVIYGWSINPIDYAISEDIHEDVPNSDTMAPDVTIVVSYNDTQESRSILTSNVDELISEARLNHGNIRFSVLDDIPE